MSKDKYDPEAMARHRAEAKAASEVLLGRMHAGATSAYNHGKQSKDEVAKAAFHRAYSGFLELAKLGHAMSAGYLGLMYKNGYVPDSTDSAYNEGRAALWMARAIAMGDPTPQAALDKILEGATLEEAGIPPSDVAGFVDALQANGGAIAPEALAEYFEPAELAAMANPMGDMGGLVPAPHGGSAVAGGAAASASAHAAAAAAAAYGEPDYTEDLVPLPQEGGAVADGAAASASGHAAAAAAAHDPHHAAAGGAEEVQLMGDHAHAAGHVQGDHMV